MIADEKFNKLLHSNVRFDYALGALGLLMAASTIAFIVYVARHFGKKGFQFNQVTILKVEWSDAFSLVFLLTLLRLSPETSFLIYPAAILGVLFVLRHNQTYIPEFWGLKRINSQRLFFLAIWLTLVVFVILYPISAAVDALSHYANRVVTPQDSVNLLLESRDPAALAWLLFAALVVAPMAEEILFRGFFYPLFKARMPAFLALLLTSFIFALLHFDLFTFLQLWAFGLFLGAVFEHTGSLPLCIALHMTFNACNAIWLLTLKYLP